MVPFMRHEASVRPASGRKNITKPRRRVTKDEISRPSLLPWEGSQSLLRNTSALENVVKAHKRSQSAPSLTGWRGWGSPFGFILYPDISRFTLSSTSTSENASESALARQMGTQSLHIIFPPANKDKSIPAIPCLGHISLGAAEFPNVTFTDAIPKVATLPEVEQEAVISPILCATMEELLDQNTAKRIETQFSDIREREDAEDMYAEAASLAAMEDDQDFEPACRDTSMILPTPDCRARSTIYSFFIGDDYTVHDAASQGNDQEPMSRSHLPPEGTFLARVSKCLDDADIPYTITKSESVAAVPSHPEKGDEVAPSDLTLVPDACGDLVLQVYRQGLEDFEEELLAKEIIFTRGSDYVHRRHSRQRSVEEANALLTRRQGELFHANFLRPRSTAHGAEEILGFLVKELEEKVALVKELAEEELLAKELIVQSLERKFKDADTCDSDEDSPPSEY